MPKTRDKQYIKFLRVRITEKMRQAIVKKNQHISEFVREAIREKLGWKK